MPTDPHPSRARFVKLAALAASLWGMLCAPASAQLLRGSDDIEAAQGIDVVEKLGETLPLDVVFTNAEGESQPLSRYINGSRPTLMVMVYFDCPMICPVVLDHLRNALNELDYVAGEDFNVMVVSFDPTDTPTHALNQKMTYLSSYVHGMEPTIASGWQFMTGKPAAIRDLKDALGFKIKLLDNGEYSHPVAVAAISPDGVITRYIYGLGYDPDQVRLSLLEATDGTIAKSIGERVLFKCFRYNPSEGKYTLHAMTLMRFGGGFTVAALALLIGGLFLKERVRRRSDRPGSNDHDQSRPGLRPVAVGGTA